MQEQLQTIRTYLRMAWLYRWLGTAVAVISCIGGWIVVQALPNEFTVTAKIYLDSSSMLRPLLKGIAFNTSMLGDTALILNRTLLTRPNLEEVARRADLDLQAKTPEEFEEVVEGLATRIKIATTKKDNIFDITYTDIEPKLAKLVVDELLNTFLEASLGDNRRETAVTQQFLEEQIGSYEKRLVEAEERLKDFKQRNVGVMPGSQGGYFNRLQESHTQLTQAKLELEEAMHRAKQLKGQTSEGGEEDLFGSMDYGSAAPTSPEIQALDARIQSLEQRAEELLLTYTEKYPDVVAIRETIANLKGRKEEKLKELQEQSIDAPMMEEPMPTADPYQQQLKLQVAEADAQVAALQTRVKEYERRVTELERKVDTVPEVEAELARLNRDYEINKNQYDELLKRRELAYMAQEANQTEDDVKIKVIEPPRVPFAPSGPNRILLASVVLLIGLAAGGAVAVVLSQLNPRIIGIPDLKDITGLPVLGAISMNSHVLYRRQRTHEVMLFSAALAGILLIYVTQILLQQLGVDLHDKISSVIGAIA